MNSCRHLLQLRWPVVHGVLLIVGCGGETSNGTSSATGGNSFVGVGGQSGLGGYASLGGVAALGGTGVNSSTTNDAGNSSGSSGHYTDAGTLGGVIGSNDAGSSQDAGICRADAVSRGLLVSANTIDMVDCAIPVNLTVPHYYTLNVAVNCCAGSFVDPSPHAAT